MANALKSSGATSIPDGWQVVRLGDVATMSQGGTPRKDRSEYWDGHIPFVTGADLTKFRIGRRNARSFLTDQGLYSGGTVVCEPGSLLLATRTAVGLAGMATETLGASQDITCLVTNGRVDAEYLCRSLVGLASSLKRRSRGTTIQGITREDVTSLHILLPPLTEQWAIATVLDSIDDAIERIEAVIASTEQLRDSLLHELLTRGVPGWHTEWKEAPGIGTIPACWEVARLGDVLETTTYGTNVSLDGGGRVSILRMNNLQDGEIDLTEVRSADLANEELRKLSLVPGDILFNRTNSLDLVGKVAVVRNLPQPISFASYLVRLRVHRTRANPFWLSSLLRFPDCQSRIRKFATRGVSQANINPTSLKSLLIPLPSLLEQQVIAAMLDGVDDAIRRVHEERNRLQSLEASTAEALLTGRVRTSGQCRS